MIGGMWSALLVWLAPLGVLVLLVVGVDPAVAAHLHQVVAQVHQLRSCLTSSTAACGGG